MSEGWPTPYGRTCAFGHQMLNASFCEQCAICSICQKPLTIPEYQFCKLMAERDGEQPVFEHPGCLKEIDRLALQSETIEIPRALFDKLNAARLLIEPLEDLNIRTNELDADIQTQRWIHLAAQNRSHEEYMEYLYVTLRRLESSAATTSLAVSKFRRAIEESFSERDKQASDSKGKLNAQAIANAKREKERRAHADLAPGTHAHTAKKKQTREQKLLTFLMSTYGYTEDEAKESLLKTKTKNGDSVQ